METLTRKKLKGTELQVFSRREAVLNRVIFKILRQKGALIPYDIFLQVRTIKGFMHFSHKTVCRRTHALEKGGWIILKGTRNTKSGEDRNLYQLSLKGKAALALDEKSMDVFLETANDERLSLLIAALE
jgi:DNA-binding PadR family transcriptional regulator